MTERGARNDCGFEQQARGMLSQTGTTPNITILVGVLHQLQKGYCPSFHHELRNAANVGDVN
jgi:hypothetical protein